MARGTERIKKHLGLDYERAEWQWDKAGGCKAGIPEWGILNEQIDEQIDERNQP